MNKVRDILFKEDFKIECLFTNGESRILELKEVLNDKYSHKIFNSTVFQTARVGQFGEIYWSGIAEMKDEKGNVIPCEYDLSSEFAYHNSYPV